MNAEPGVLTVIPISPGMQYHGCLPAGFDLDSLLTPEQFAMWQQLAVSTVRGMLKSRTLPGAIYRTRENIRVHPRTYLEKSITKSR